MSDDFRCSVDSRNDHEQLAGTAPADTELLLVEHPGPWGRQAVAESRLPAEVKDHLAALDGVRVQLVRRPGGVGGPGVRVFHATATEAGFRVTTARLAQVDDLLALDLGSLSPYEGVLWLVCTNGRRDRCCAEVGRPIAAGLAARWPEETWETTHLGGHRFAGTLLALPSGHTLGRLSADNVVAACAELEAGGVPLDLSRGRAGRSGADQVRELHALAGGDPDDEVVEVAGPDRRQSCGGLELKATTRFEVRPRGRPAPAPR
ncbi:sucrase ferredoxin [Nocardioides piscis]|uniref:Sucrase ferredoxin n=1 Tax=Nocardioides piscis TaxID=2714938 RepID=A0A6G7YEC4_9ACTN|nr:sucrase ferredoxin [Nocardioides piscis]QIK75120.1 sucrase ferredoxin [Nocardioides piscis]